MRPISIDRREFVIAAGAAAALGGAIPCRTAGQEATPDPIDLPDLAITAVDYAFEMPASVAGGWTHVIMDNQGNMEHHAMFLRPHEDSTVEDVQAALQQPDFGAIFAVASSVGGTNVGPGQQASVVMNLEAGQYVVICAIPGPDGMPHYAMGMQAVLEVTEGAGEGSAPEADASLMLIEMEFEGLPGDVSAGTHVWEVTNGGEQLHELLVARLAEGVSFEMVQQMMSAPPPSPGTSIDVAQAPASPVVDPGPPFAGIGGVAPISPGATNYAVLDLEAGEHFAICFVPDPQTGAPHFALGMMAPFTVA